MTILDPSKVSRKERRGESNKSGAQHEYAIADLGCATAAVSGFVSEGGADDEAGAKRRITKLEGPWSPEEDHELIKVASPSSSAYFCQRRGCVFYEPPLCS